MNEFRGKPTTCKKCKHKWSHISRESKKIWHEEKMPCPVCGALYCTLPEPEDKLRILQDELISLNSDEMYKRNNLLSDIYIILCDYARSMLLKRYRSVVYDPDMINYYAQKAASLVVEGYLEKPDFRIKISFGGLLSLKLPQSIWEKDEQDLYTQIENKNVRGKKTYKAYSIDYEYENEGKQAFQLEDNTDFVYDLSNQIDSYMIKKHLYKLIEMSNDFINDPESNLKRLFGIFLFMKKGEEKADEFFRLYDLKGKLEYQKTLQLIKSELIRLSEY